MIHLNLSTFDLVTVLFIMTFLHHVYGGIKYYTPKVNRLKIAGLLVVMFVITVALYIIGHSVHWVSWAYKIFTLVWWVGGLGVFEGGYNHLVKVILWAARVKPSKLEKLFPPEEYVLPNDILFEGTGILTFIMGILVTLKLF